MHCLQLCDCALLKAGHSGSMSRENSQMAVYAVTAMHDPSAEASASAAESGMEQDLEADAAREEQHYAKVQVAREQQAEDDAFQEEQSFDRDHVRAPPDSADGELGASLEATADSSGEVHASRCLCTTWCMHGHT